MFFIYATGCSESSLFFVSVDFDREFYLTTYWDK